jgi:hypothetical protein
MVKKEGSIEGKVKPLYSQCKIKTVLPSPAFSSLHKCLFAKLSLKFGDNGSYQFL